MNYTAGALRAIVRTAITLIDLWSPEAEELLLGTAAKESRMGQWLKQIEGPALGVFQVEPDTMNCHFENYLRFRPDLLQLVTEATGCSGPSLGRLQYDPVYGAVMARLKYVRVEAPLPPAHDVVAQAEYWNDHYNANLVHGWPEEYVTSYCELVMGALILG